MASFHPDLRFGRFIPRFSFGPRLVAFAQWATKRLKPPKIDDVDVENLSLPNAPGVGVRVYRPKTLKTPAPALLWLHGGGFIIGSPEQDELSSAFYARELGIVVVAVRYRLAPKHPYPTPLEDCYSALKWLHGNASSLGVDPARIAIGGPSAGGGLTAGLALLAHDRKEVPLVFQLLIYPMLDDRTVTRTDHDTSHARVWTTGSNRYGWRSYLKQEPGAALAPEYAAPARRGDLSGLPPAWVGVGTFDLFHDEDLEYARRLKAAGVPCEVTIVPGAFHGFDALKPSAPVAREFRRSPLALLRKALFE